MRGIIIASLLAACSAKKTNSPQPQDDAGARVYSVATDKAVAKAIKEATGQGFGEECIHRPEALADVVVVGSFASDRGCMPIGAFVKGQWLRTKALLESGLSTYGWQSMSPKEQDTLATLWIEEVILTYRGSRFLTKAEPAFEFPDTPAFLPLQSQRVNSEVAVGGWTARPSGMINESSYLYSEYAIATNGAITARGRASFGVPGPRLREAQLK